jgi:hypothetical protein
MVTRYRGFSTIGRTKKFRLTDLELVKRDLLNHFSIRKGEKLMDPNFGSIIWNMLYEPLTADVKSSIVEDVKRINGLELQEIIEHSYDVVGSEDTILITKSNKRANEFNKQIRIIWKNIYK